MTQSRPNLWSSRKLGLVATIFRLARIQSITQVCNLRNATWGGTNFADCISSLTSAMRIIEVIRVATKLRKLVDYLSEFEEPTFAGAHVRVGEARKERHLKRDQEQL